MSSDPSRCLGGSVWNVESVERIRDRNTARVRIGVGIAGLLVALMLGALMLYFGVLQPSVGTWGFLLVLIGVAIASIVGGLRTLRIPAPD